MKLFAVFLITALFAGVALAEEVTAVVSVGESVSPETGAVSVIEPTLTSAQPVSCTQVQKVCQAVTSESTADNVVASQYCEETLVQVPCEQSTSMPVQGECKTIEQQVCESTPSAPGEEALPASCKTVPATVCAQAAVSGGEAGPTAVAPAPTIVKECPQFCKKTMRQVCTTTSVATTTQTTATKPTRTEAVATTIARPQATEPAIAPLPPQPIPVEGGCRIIEVEECVPSPDCVASQGIEYPRMLCRRDCEGAVGKPGFDLQKCFTWCESIAQPVATAVSSAETASVDSMGDCVSKTVKECAAGQGQETAECKQKAVEQCQRTVWKQEATESTPADAVGQCVMARCVQLATEDYAKCKRECFAAVPVPTAAAAPSADVCSQIPEANVQDACSTFNKMVEERGKCRELTNKSERVTCLFEKIVLPLLEEDYGEYKQKPKNEKEDDAEKAVHEAETAVQSMNVESAQAVQECSAVASKAAQRITEFKNRATVMQQAIDNAESKEHDATELRYLLIKYNEVLAASANSFAAQNCRESLETLATAEELMKAFKETLKKIVEANNNGETHAASAVAPVSTEVA